MYSKLKLMRFFLKHKLLKNLHSLAKIMHTHFDKKRMHSDKTYTL